MNRSFALPVVIMSLSLTACNLPLSNTNNTLIDNSLSMTGHFTSSDLQAWLQNFPADQQTLLGSPVCGMKAERYEYVTVGGLHEPTTASGVVMMPTGSDPSCHGQHSIVLYTHGTSITHSFDLSAVNDATNDAYGAIQLLALNYVAHGYIVIGPNYAGYNTSTLTYHPYLNGDQQSQDVIDGLTAGRQVIQKLDTDIKDNGKLFVEGYSQGGYVAMATLRALDQRGQPATAGVPMSGPYALEAFGDQIFNGNVGIGSTVYASMILNSYEHLPDNMGPLSASDLLNPLYATADKLFPGNYTFNDLPTLSSQNILPLNALFQSSPTGNATLDQLTPGPFLFGQGFDTTDYLIQTSYRASYVQDAIAHPDGAVPMTATPTLAQGTSNGLRQLFNHFDLRNYQPSMPLLMCGGHGDPEVYLLQNGLVVDTLLNQAAATHPGLRFGLLDLDTRKGPIIPVALGFSSQGFTPDQQTAMQSAYQTIQADFVAQQNAQETYNFAYGLEKYHTNEEPYCSLAARQFFSQF